MELFFSTTEAHGIFIRRVWEFENPVTIDDILRTNPHLNPPHLKEFCYVKETASHVNAIG